MTEQKNFDTHNLRLSIAICAFCFDKTKPQCNFYVFFRPLWKFGCSPAEGSYINAIKVFCNRHTSSELDIIRSKYIVRRNQQFLFKIHFYFLFRELRKKVNQKCIANQFHSLHNHTSFRLVEPNEFLFSFENKNTFL